MNRLKLIYASGQSAIISIIAAVVVTLAAEYSPGFEKFLKIWTGHHWTTKSLVVAVVYLAGLVLIYFSKNTPTPPMVRRSLRLVTAAAILGYAILLLFFVARYKL